VPERVIGSPSRGRRPAKVDLRTVQDGGYCNGAKWDACEVEAITTLPLLSGSCSILLICGGQSAGYPSLDPSLSTLFDLDRIKYTSKIHRNASLEQNNCQSTFTYPHREGAPRRSPRTFSEAVPSPFGGLKGQSHPSLISSE
jgi:hypothetical protein